MIKIKLSPWKKKRPLFCVNNGNIFHSVVGEFSSCEEDNILTKNKEDEPAGNWRERGKNTVLTLIAVNHKKYLVINSD